MSKSKPEFTPAPWKAYKRPEPIGFAWWEIHWPEDGECVAEVVHEEADAKLISAAPDLYEALEELMEIVEGIRLGDYKPDSFTCQPARFALSKAGWTGRDTE